MENEDARRAYEVYLQELMVQRLQIGAMLALAMPPIGVALVGFADQYSFRFMMAFLLIVYAFVLVLIPWSRTRWFYRHSFTLGMAANVLLVAVVAWLVINMDVAWTSPVMAILLCIASVCVGSLYPFHAWQAGLFSVYCLAVYIVPIPFLEASTIGWVDYGANILVLISFGLIAATESYHTNRLRRMTFFSQFALSQANEALRQEREKSERLLQNMLPASIAERLKTETKAIADKYAEATVLFTDLVGFTRLPSTLLPSRLVGLIDDLFSRFDNIVEKHGLEKIKTIGDSYMAVGGLPVENDCHAISAAEAALEMREEILKFNAESGESLNVRVGIHSGPVVAGVIGRKKLSYDVWGDTVNTASRMESSSENGKIQVSETTYHLLKGKYRMEERGDMEIKGKGIMKTYYLASRAGDHR